MFYQIRVSCFLFIMIICMASKAINVAGLILVFLSCCWSHRLQTRYSGLDKMLGNHCLDSFGNLGVCMFKWECLSKDGAMLSTCVDGFLFGACCALKSGDRAEGDRVAHQQQENNIPNAHPPLHFRPVNSSLKEQSSNPRDSNPIQSIRSDSHATAANNNKTFETGHLENNNSSLKPVMNVTNMSKSLLSNLSVAENLTDVPTNTDSAIIDYFSELIYDENDSTNFQLDLKDSTLKKHSVSDQLFSIILRKNNFSKLALEENVFSDNPAYVNSNVTNEYEAYSTFTQPHRNSETIHYFNDDDVETQKNANLLESNISSDLLNDNHETPDTFSSSTAALPSFENHPSFSKDFSKGNTEIQSLLRSKEKLTYSQSQENFVSSLHDASTDRNSNSGQDASSIPSNFQEVLNQLIFSNDNGVTPANTQNYEKPIDLDYLASQPLRQIVNNIRIDSSHSSSEMASDADKSVSQTFQVTEAYEINFDKLQNETSNQSQNQGHSNHNDPTSELTSQKYSPSDVSQIFRVTMCPQEPCGKGKNNRNKTIQEEPTKNLFAQHTHTENRLNQSDFTDQQIQNATYQQQDFTIMTDASATEEHTHKNDHQSMTNFHLTASESDLLFNNIDESQHLLTVPSSFSSASFATAYPNSESNDVNINRITDWLVSQNLATSQSTSSQYTSRINLVTNNEIVETEHQSATTQQYEETSQTSVRTDKEMYALTTMNADTNWTDFDASSTLQAFSTQRATEETSEFSKGYFNTVERTDLTDSSETTQLSTSELSTTITNTVQEFPELFGENNSTTSASMASATGASSSIDDLVSDSTSAESHVDSNELIDTNYSVPFVTSYNQETTPVNYKWDYKKECGVRPMQAVGRIVGGQNTYLGKWPWQALVKEATWLGLFVKNKCGGVLISSKYVLTAAHCQPGFLASLLVLLGTHDLKENAAPVIRNVKRMVVHRNYNPLTFENDLAILEMDSELEFLPYVIPICLPQSDEDFTGKMAFVTGWGKLTHGGDVPNILQEVQVPIVTNKDCQRMFYQAGHQKAIQNNFVCAGYRNGGQDSCEGDSGGPLMVQRQDKRWVLVGTVSHGIGCADPNLPGVYMRMSSYIAWIDSIIKKS